MLARPKETFREILELLTEFDYRTYGFTLIAIALGLRIRINTPPIMDEPIFPIVRERMNFPHRLRYGRTFLMPMLSYYVPAKYRRILTLTLFAIALASLIDAEERFRSNAVVPVVITYMLILFEDVYSSLFSLAAYLYYRKGRILRGSSALTIAILLKPVSPLAVFPVIFLYSLYKKDLKALASLAIPIATLSAILYSAAHAFSESGRGASIAMISLLRREDLLALIVFSLSAFPFTMYIGLTRRRLDRLLIRLSDLAVNFYIFEFVYHTFYNRHFIISSASAGVLSAYKSDQISLLDKLVAISFSALYVYFYTIFYGLLGIVYTAFRASIRLLGIIGILISKNLQQLIGAYTLSVGPLTAAILGAYRIYPYMLTAYYNIPRGEAYEKASLLRLAAIASSIL